MIDVQGVKNHRYLNYYLGQEIIEEEVIKASNRGDNEVYVYLTCTKIILKKLIEDLEDNGFEITSGLKRMDGDYTVRYIRIRW